MTTALAVSILTKENILAIAEQRGWKVSFGEDHFGRELIDVEMWNAMWSVFSPRTDGSYQCDFKYHAGSGQVFKSFRLRWKSETRMEKAIEKMIAA